MVNYCSVPKDSVQKKKVTTYATYFLTSPRPTVIKGGLF